MEPSRKPSVFTIDFILRKQHDAFISLWLDRRMFCFWHLLLAVTNNDAVKHLCPSLFVGAGKIVLGHMARSRTAGLCPKASSVSSALAFREVDNPSLSAWSSEGNQILSIGFVNNLGFLK